MTKLLRDTMPVERIKEVINYDGLSGVFTWNKKTRHNMPAVGTQAGGMRNKYYYIRIDEVDYPASRIAWAILHGETPDGRVCFKDMNPKNLCADNLFLKPSLFKGCDFQSSEGRAKYQGWYRSLTLEQRKERSLKSSFGIGLREYEDMLIAQKGCCAICSRRETAKRKGKDVALAVDHCHKTGEIRGLLCTACNMGLGKFEDNETALVNAATYLQKHKEKKVATNVVQFAKP